MTKSTDYFYSLNTIVNCMVIITLFTPISLCNNTSFIASTKPLIEKFSKQLENLRNEELIVPFVNKIYGTYKYVMKDGEILKNSKNLANELSFWINSIFSILEKGKSYFRSSNRTNLFENLHTLILPCKVAQSLQVNKSEAQRNIHERDILERIETDLWIVKNMLKQVFLLSSNDLNQFGVRDTYKKCEGIDHFLLWKNYMLHLKHLPRRVIILFDQGSEISMKKLQLTKLLVKGMISVLNPSDKFAIISIASSWSSLIVNQPCGEENLPSILSATESNKELSYDFIDSLTNKNELVNHNLGMQIVMKMARLFYSGDEPILLMYISGGHSFSLQESINIMNIVTRTNLSCPIILNTCFIPLEHDENAPHGLILLPDIMNEYNMQKNKNRLFAGGRLITLKYQETIGLVVEKLYNAFKIPSHVEGQKISLPMWDSVSQDTAISLTTGFFVDNRFFLLGVDVFFSKFVRDIIDFSSNQKYTYAILTDFQGRVFIHPLMSMETIQRQAKLRDISKYVKSLSPSTEPNFRGRFFEKSEDVYVFNGTEPTKYAWNHVNKHFVVLVVVNKSEEPTRIPADVNWYSGLANHQLVSYFFDITVGTTFCKYENQLATTEMATLYLSPSCFQHLDSFSNMSGINFQQPENLLMKNEGLLRPGIRDETAALVHIVDLIRKRHLSSLNSEYIVRRYVATKSGILQVFPGVVFAKDNNFRPNKRPWFLKAIEFEGRLIMGSPYLDPGGSGYIVTLSYATNHLVIGIDVTYGFIFKNLLEQIPDCDQLNVTCFLVDDRGYLVFHPNLFNTDNNEPYERYHVVHKESSVANDLLNYDDLIKKLACNDLNSGTIQRQYRLNLTYENILEGAILGEACVSYIMSSLKETNVFLGVVRTSCAAITPPTFCPCSVIDRLCLNCQRMEKKECECPCECPLRHCISNKSREDYNICNYIPEELFSPGPEFLISENTNLCFPTRSCESRTSFMTCLGVIGCEWCNLDLYGYPLSKPFCGSVTACFNGIVGSQNPYKNNPVTGDDANGFSSVKGTGLILGLMLVFGFLLGLIFVCWKSYNNNTNRRRPRTYLSAARRQEQLHLSDLHIDEDFLHNNTGNHSDKLLIENKKFASISPYSVSSPNYARSTAAADSDHGYSTMTPHDESEHMSLTAPVEVNDFNSDDSPPLKHKTQLMTKIPHQNCIVVPVIVHKHIDAT